MARINLLPWREELRKKRQQEFAAIAAVAVPLMVGVIYGWQWLYQERIDFQKSRNQYLESQLSILDKKIKNIKDLNEEKRRLIARMEIIQELQVSRPEVVHLVDAIVTTLPEGVFYEKLVQKDNLIAVEGTAQANAYVSSLMRNLEANKWLANPVLKEIASQSKKNNALVRLAEFKLEVTHMSEQDAEKDDG